MIIWSMLFKKKKKNPQETSPQDSVDPESLTCTEVNKYKNKYKNKYN